MHEKIEYPFKGRQLTFLPPEMPTEKKARSVYLLISLLCDGYRKDWKKMINLSVLRAILIRRDPEILALGRDLFRQGFANLFAQLKDQEMTPETLTQAQIFIANCRIFITYFELCSKETVHFPEWIDDHWELVDYSIEPILMTPKKPGLNLFHQSIDRFYAYGFVPREQTRAKTHLVYSGTPYPAALAFWISVEADLQAGQTLGEPIFRAGHDIIKKWLRRQKLNGRQIEASGISLGASLALLTAIEHGNYLTGVHAYNPAGLYPHKKPSDLDCWDRLSQKPAVRVICQGRDPVSKLGVFKPDWEMLYLNPDKKDQVWLSVLDHAFNFAGEEKTEFSQMNPEDRSQANARNNRWIYGRGRSLLYHGLVAPYHFGLRPGIYLIKNHWVVLGGSSLLVLEGAAVGMLLSGMLLPALATASAGMSMSMVYALMTAIHTATQENLSPDADLPHGHFEPPETSVPHLH